jgi:hypothetical protein
MPRKLDQGTKWCLAILVIVVIIAIICLLRRKPAASPVAERFGELMDQACLAGDCSTDAGIAAAVQKCQQALKEELGGSYGLVAAECDPILTPDPDIRAQGCPEPCDVNSVADYIRYKKPPTCASAPQQVCLDFNGQMVPLASPSCLIGDDGNKVTVNVCKDQYGNFMKV